MRAHRVLRSSGTRAGRRGVDRHPSHTRENTFHEVGPTPFPPRQSDDIQRVVAVSFIETIAREFGTKRVVVIHEEATSSEQRFELEAQIQADSGFFAVDARIYEGDIVEVPDRRGGMLRHLVAKVDVNDVPEMPEMSHIQAHWGRSTPPLPLPMRRRLMVLLFTDIVGSTDQARQLGDERWAQVLATHHEVFRSLLADWGGSEVDTAGDGFFATFEGVADGLSCALSAVQQLEECGTTIRAGLHVGEAEQGEKPSGLEVNAAARIMSCADDGTVFVSTIVSDLLSEDVRFEFEDRGEFELKGIGRKHLAAVRWSD